MKQVISIIQIIISVALISLILMQAKGTGFGRTSGMSGGTSFTRRGLEKLVFRMTFFLAGAFLILSVVLLWV